MLTTLKRPGPWLTALLLGLGLAHSGLALAGKSGNHGTVTELELRQIEERGESRGDDDNNMTGTAIGAAAGALVGRSVSGKKDKTKGTIIGGIVGGIAGNQVQKQMGDQGGREEIRYRDLYIVHVRFDDGHRERYEFDEEPDFREGDRVKDKDGRLRRE
ncbi:MAG: glycine zipper 2TM domain-containing protein [Gammaproteobacteria bacterium]|nr:glycine zipper 2TM domain-containing protein [Gammaproteobacteria bacterium]